MRSSLPVVGVSVLAAISLHASRAHATTYQVGPTRQHTQLEQFEQALAPGDVVELDGDATYDGDVWIQSSGTAAAPVTIRGITVNGRRPVISGGDYTLMLKGGFYVVENVEVTAGAEVCLFQKAENLVLRDSLVRDCDKHGILGADWGTGSFLMERDEVYGCGSGDYKHQVYVATDETTFPGSTFRMEGCWIHDARGGINVKSRAERVELYGNWIEGAEFHELDLIGSQDHPVDMAREDSDVVGNVLVKAPGNVYAIARVGGDGTGDSHGRHRFVNNTIVLADATSYAFRLAGLLESFELHDNVIYGNGPTQLWREELAGTMSVSGMANWMSESITLIDDRVSGVRGADPGFADLGAQDYRPILGSLLVDAAIASPPAPPGLEVPGAQAIPAFTPFVPGVHGYAARPIVGGLDVGAFELGDGSGTGTGGGGASTGTGAGGDASGPSASSTGTGTGTGTGGDGGGTAGPGGDGASGSTVGAGGAASDGAGGEDDGDPPVLGSLPRPGARGAGVPSHERSSRSEAPASPGCSVGTPSSSSSGLSVAAMGAALGILAAKRRAPRLAIVTPRARAARPQG